MTTRNGMYVDPKAGIAITNTRNYFIIRDVYVHPPTVIPESSGVYLINTQNGRLENSRIANASYGVWMSLSTNNVLSNNIFWGITRTALYIVGGAQDTITGNIMSSNFPGVRAPLLSTLPREIVIVGLTPSNGVILSSDPKLKYVDVNSNSLWTALNPNEPVIYDSNSNDVYDAGEPVVNGTTPAPATGLQIDQKIKYIDDNNNNIWDTSETVVYDQNLNNKYDLGDPRVKFVDSNNDGVWTQQSATNPLEPVVYDSDNDNTYLQSEPVIFGSTPANGTHLKTDPKIKVFDINNSGTWDPGDVVVQDANNNSIFNSGENVLSPLSPEGFRVMGATQDTITNNTIQNMHTGFLMSNVQNSLIDRNMLANASYYGFRITGGNTGNSFRNNTITRISFGLVFDNSDHNLARGNMILENDYGIGLEGLSAPNHDITVTGNRVVDNLYGIYVYNSVQNLIYNNYLNNTASNGFDPTSQNFWNTTKTLGTNILGGPFLGGNFYNNYAGTDQDGDGIGDSSYNIQSQGTDRLPLVRQQPSVVRDLAVSRVTVQPPSIVPGDSFTITVYPFNQGTVPETFTVTTYYDQNLLNTTSLTLPAWTRTSYSFQWNSTGLSTRTYSVTANATIIPGERDPADNIAPAEQATVNRPPTASFTITPQAPTANLPASFDASQSSDPDGNVAAYFWDFGDTQTSIGRTTSHTYTDPGQYTVTLIVTDNLGGNATLSRTATVVPTPNQDPVADLTASTTSPQVGQQITLDASNSHDPDGTITTYSWNFGDSRTGNGPVITHTYTSPGTYTVSLRVTDNVGATTTKTVDLQVSASKPSLPTNLKITTGTDKITLTWTAPSSDGGSQISQYRIYRGLNRSSLALLAQVGNVNLYEDKAVLRGETYYYKVSAVNAAGFEGDFSETVNGRLGGSAIGFLDSPILLAEIGGIAVLAAVIVLLLWRRPKLKSPQLQ